MTRGFDAGAIVDQLTAIYDESVANLRAALAAYMAVAGDWRAY